MKRILKIFGVIVAVCVVLGIIGAALGGSSTETAAPPAQTATPGTQHHTTASVHPTAAPTSTPDSKPMSAPSSNPAVSFSDGTFKVGTDIQPGTYHTDGQDGCYWARLRSVDGSSVSAIITNDNPSGPVTLQIKPGDVGFESQGCGTWTLVSSGSASSGPQTSFGDGTYAVGKDIAAGTYHTAGGDGCYWQRSRDTGGASTIANDNASGPVVVTIASTDGGFKTQGCGTWTQVPAPQAGGTSGATSFGDGTWRVGVDIQPGTYRTDGQDNCYYAVLSGFGGGNNDIVNNDNPSGPVTLTLDSSTRGIKSQGCGTWTETS